MVMGKVEELKISEVSQWEFWIEQEAKCVLDIVRLLRSPTRYSPQLFIKFGPQNPICCCVEASQNSFDV